MTRAIIRTYSELIKLRTFEERFEYLKLNGQVGSETFGFDRIFNQMFYTSKEWKDFRREISVRDSGCDLACEDREIHGERILIHHMNPITLEDLETHSDFLLNPEFVITTTFSTHRAIHYGDRDLLIPSVVVERKKNDTCPWKK